jgi:hypothetical protein
VKKFILNISVFSIVTLITFYFLQVTLDRENKKNPSDTFSEWNDCYNSNINADVLVMGSSRAWVQISPKILDSTLSVNSYNLGIDGWNFLMQHCRFKVYLEHNIVPKNIIHCVDVYILDKRNDLYNAEQFVPFLNDTLIRQYTQGYKGSFNNLHYSFPLYKYNNSLKSIITPLLNLAGVKKSHSNKYKGYQGMEKDWDNSFEKFKENNPNGVVQKIDNETIREFEDYLKFCKQKDINLTLVYTPEYIEGQKMTQNRNDIIKIYEQYAAQYDFLFLNYSDDSLCLDKSLFYNSQHLNKKGAELFSAKLAQDLAGKIK